VLAPSVGLLLALCGCIIVLTELTDLPLRQMPLLGAGASTLAGPSTRSSAVTHLADTRRAPGRHSLAVAQRHHRRPPDRSRARQSATIAPVGLDRSFDLRVDLMDMAISIRWHRGAAADLPPGSN
jgi:hypothetical protein